MAQIFGDGKTPTSQGCEPSAPADPAWSRGVGVDSLQIDPSSSPAPALRRGNTPSPAAGKMMGSILPG